MTTRPIRFDAADADDLPADDWSLDEFDAIDDAAELGPVRTTFGSIDDIDC